MSQSHWLAEMVRFARSTGLGGGSLLRQSARLDSRDSEASETRDLTEQEIETVEAARAAALVEVIITYGSMCASGNHGEQVFDELRQGLQKTFGPLVFVLAREDISTYNCISVHVNNVLVFGCQARRPTVEQLCDEVHRALGGKRPQLIPYRTATVCDFYGCTQKHKYQI